MTEYSHEEFKKNIEEARLYLDLSDMGNITGNEIIVLRKLLVEGTNACQKDEDLRKDFQEDLAILATEYRRFVIRSNQLILAECDKFYRIIAGME